VGKTGLEMRKDIADKPGKRKFNAAGSRRDQAGYLMQARNRLGLKNGFPQTLMTVLFSVLALRRGNVRERKHFHGPTKGESRQSNQGNDGNVLSHCRSHGFARI